MVFGKFAKKQEVKKSSTDLYELIQSLTSSELRYFTIYASRHFTTTTHYQQLFDFMKNQEEYNEAAIIRHFKKSTWIKDFPVVKKQLYERLLTVLHQFDEYSNIEQEIKKGTHYCMILLKKGLFDQVKKQLKIYKEKAYTLEKYEYLLELIEIEKKLLSKAFLSTVDYTQINQLKIEEENCLEQITLSSKYWVQSSVVYKQHYQKKINIGQSTEELEMLVTQPEFSDFSLAKTAKAKLDFLQINALYAFIHRQPQMAFEYNHTFLQYLDENKIFRTLNADRYFSVFNNYLIDAHLLQQYDLLLAGIQKIRSLTQDAAFKHINNIEANVFRLSYLLELNYIVSQKKFEDGIKLIPIVERGLKKYNQKIIKPSIITMRYLIVYILFFHKDFDACIDQLNTMLNDRDTLKVKDIYRDAKFVEILCHFEIKNYLLVDSLIVSFQRLISKESYPAKTYVAIIKYIHKYIKNPEKANKEKLLKELMQLEKEPTEKSVYNNFDYIYWLQL